MITRKYTIEIEREKDGRWIAEVLELPGVLAYGKTQEDAHTKVEALALNVLFERLNIRKAKKHGRLAKRTGRTSIARTPAHRVAHKTA